mmetsp:Transcript_18289/g.32865  ORF Transcript_18289/g.32865 Transcript_18289/m.32865 type:complete len:258 (+) Transcript_18289:2523-3296(+)
MESINLYTNYTDRKRPRIKFEGVLSNSVLAGVTEQRGSFDRGPVMHRDEVDIRERGFFFQKLLKKATKNLELMQGRVKKKVNRDALTRERNWRSLKTKTENIVGTARGEKQRRTNSYLKTRLRSGWSGGRLLSANLQSQSKLETSNEEPSLPLICKPQKFSQKPEHSPRIERPERKQSQPVTPIIMPKLPIPPKEAKVIVGELSLALPKEPDVMRAEVSLALDLSGMHDTEVRPPKITMTKRKKAPTGRLSGDLDKL